MLLCVVGLPGAFADWCEALVGGLAERAWGPITTVRADTLEEFALEMIGTGSSQAVLSSRRPGGRLCRALAEERRNFVVALDDPRMALADLVVGRGSELTAAIRAVASSCAALVPYATAAGGLLLRSEDRPEAAGAAAALAHHLGLAVSQAEIRAVAARLATKEMAASRGEEASAWWRQLAPAERGLVEGALAPYIGGAPLAAGPIELHWSQELFLLGDGSGAPATGPIDITGRARNLLQGPGIMLPAGPWSATIELAFSREAAEREFLIQVSADRPLASATIRPPPEAAPAATIDFTLDHETESPVSIAIGTTRAAFDGAIALSGVTLRRAAAEPPAGN
jgi:hypothetical protein